MLTKSQKIFFSLVWIAFFITVFASFGNYGTNGSFMPSFKYIIMFLASNIAYLLIIIAAMVYFSMWQYKFYKRKIENRDNCQIQFVDLEKIAHAWLDKEEIERNQAANTKPLDFIDYSSIDKELAKILIAKPIRNKQLLLDYVLPYVSFYTREEIDIVCDLIEILEKNPVSSVGTLYTKDPDYVNYKLAITLDGLTSYDILATYQLETHTINVVKEMFEIAKTLFQDNISTMAAKLLIISLGHDIGKINNAQRIEEALGTIKEGLYTQKPHEAISKMILLSLYPEYKFIDTVCDAINNHHIATTEDRFGKSNIILSDYSKLLKKADSKARDNEIKLYLKEKKIQTSEKRENKDEAVVIEGEIIEKTSTSEEKVDESFALVTKKQANKILSSSKIEKKPQVEETTTKQEPIVEVVPVVASEPKVEEEMNKEEELNVGLFGNIEASPVDEKILKELLRSHVNLVVQKASGKHRLISCSDSTGEIIYYDELTVRELLKSIKVDGEVDRIASVKDRQINPIISYLISLGIIKSTQIAIHNIETIFPSKSLHKVYQISSKYIEMEPKRILELKSSSDYLQNATVKIIVGVAR